jgi:steroid delta-isomerase-like uncharacterized protein
MNTNRDVVIQLYQAFDRNEFEIVKSMLTEDFAAHLVGMSTPLNRAEFTEFGIKFKQAFPDGCHHFDRPICEADRVVTSGRFIGTHLGNFQGLPATGRSISIAVMHIDRLCDGKVIEHWGQGDQAGMMQQLGIVSLPGIGLFFSAIRQQLGINKQH